MTPGNSELVAPVPPRNDSDEAGENGWWTQYRRRLGGEGLSRTAIEAISDDSRRIADLAVPLQDSSSLDISAWGSTRLRRGIVVGSVQSGKTASMLGVSALALDRGVAVIVVLAGTRIALWKQTYERVLGQLDGSAPRDNRLRTRVRTLVPLPLDLLVDGARPSADEYLATVEASAERAMELGRPLICVVPKIDVHLNLLGRSLRKWLRKRPRHQHSAMLVLDDEADDASVLTAEYAESRTPRHISELWGTFDEPESTAEPTLLATYVAYTATPQANFLQASHNPLYPRDFAAVLRTPGQRESKTTYTEPLGIMRYYHGGSYFYRPAEGYSKAVRSVPYPEPEPGESGAEYRARFRQVRFGILGDALRSYLVGGAVRLLVEGTTFDAWPDTGDFPNPHTMLFHPSGSVEDHFEGAAELVNWLNSPTGGLQRRPAGPASVGTYDVDAHALSERIHDEEELWVSWLEEFSHAFSALQARPGGEALSDPRRVSWGEVRDCLLERVIPALKIKVLNSDRRSDNRPSFKPRPSSDMEGEMLPPDDVYTIFVAGNVLSRGLTVDGLATSLFLRRAGEPAADTQMQMQRWFGYRGRQLPFCRVFTFEDQVSFFSRFHETDEALKSELATQIETSEGEPLVLHGGDFWATRKVRLSRQPLFPGDSPEVRSLEFDDQPTGEQNLELLRELVACHHGRWTTVQTGRSNAGVVSGRPLPLLETAALLDGLVYSSHSPGASSQAAAVWNSLERRLGAKDLFRPNLNLPEGEEKLSRERCPYSIAAYLRFWHFAVRNRDLPGIYPTDRSDSVRWASLDLARYREREPRFYVGIKYGSGARTQKLPEPIQGQPIRPTERKLTLGGSAVAALWGSRGHAQNFLGDQLIDYHIHESQPVPQLHTGDRLVRPAGHPGLILFYVVPRGNSLAVALGVAIPRGGPDHFQALRATA